MHRQTLATIALVVACAAPVAAQVDPLLFIKKNPANGVSSKPNVLVMVDAGNRMQRDAPTDPTNSDATSNYYDPAIYSVSSTSATVQATLGLSFLDTTFRRRYNSLQFQNSGSSDKYGTPWISVVSNRSAVTNPSGGPAGQDARSDYTTFEAPTRLSVARAALYQAIAENQMVARFGLYKMRQSNPSISTDLGTVYDSDPRQNVNGTTEAPSGRWYITRPQVSARNSSLGASTAYSTVVAADANNANTTILTTLGKDLRTAGGIIPASMNDANTVDEPVKFMLDDLKTEASRLVGADTACRNTVAILITGGGEGLSNGSPVSGDPVAAASTFLTAIAGRRVPIIVIAIAPPSADVTQLRQIASNSGGQYFEITKQNIDDAIAASTNTPRAWTSQVAGTIIVPQMVRAIEIGVQTAFENFSDLNATTAVAASWPWTGFNGYVANTTIPSSEFQVTSPIIGTVNLENGHDINGNALQNTIVYDKANNKIPQRSNLMVTSGFALPGFDGVLRAFRVYVPVADSTQPSGYKFTSKPSPAQEKRLWIASTPSDPTLRNLYTALPDGTVVAFNTTNASVLAPLMNLSVADATAVIDHVRSQPIGAVVDSTPAIMNPPSLDPPPDDAYPGFAVANKNRRSMVWVGTNRGIFEGIDARSGIEVWGFIPLNLLPKLKTIRDGQPVGKFDYFVDGSPKVADVRIDGVWKTYLIMGEGPGGTFYQTFDVTMSDMSSTLDPTSDNIATVLTYFSDPTKIQFVWSFPRYSVFDPSCSWQSGGCAAVPLPGTANSEIFGTGHYGGLSASATAVEKTVGQTWSDPAVGEVVNNSAPYSILIGSGFLPYSIQQQANRGGAVAGTTFYILNAKDGTVFASKNVGSDGNNETVDDCTTNATGCKQIKNALQTDPVATGPSDSRFITKAYIGDLDGNLWRLDVNLDTNGLPTVTATTKLYAAGNDQPIFNSMATVNVGGTQQYVFYGTGSDLLPGTDKNTVNHLLGVLDNGASGTKTMDQALVKTSSGNTILTDERVTAFPAVAGDIVFFTTTTFKPGTPCTLPDANLYAFTFIGGPAYDNTGDNTVGKTDTPLVKTVAGARATAPFIVDQHLAFSTGAGNVEMFGDPDNFNNGIGQAGVRILSWRQVR